jgi:glutathione synthase/RimK-type ligase-like ATP-grasp enzyme
MMREIILLTNHKGNFANKTVAKPYHSGLDKKLFLNCLENRGFKGIYISPADISFQNDYRDSFVLYSSSEDYGGHYRSYVQDIVYAFELQGANVIPSYKFLHAHHNKVFMEQLRDLSNLSLLQNLKSWHFGTYQQFEEKKDQFLQKSIVVKKYSGASSTGVSLAHNITELSRAVKAATSSRLTPKQKYREFIRRSRNNGYQQISSNRRKVILQEFIPKLTRDWKVLVYRSKIFVVERPVRRNDFRASGSGKSGYNFGSNADIPQGMFDYALEIYKHFDVPFISLDIAYDGNSFYTLEFQFIGFGTSGVQMSESFFERNIDKWEDQKIDFSYEQLYADTIVDYINEKFE